MQIFIIVDSKTPCVPYTIEACKAAALKSGLTFVKASESYSNKGCYAYNETDANYGGKVYFGTGGFIYQRQIPFDESSNKYRPADHDCRGNGKLKYSTLNSSVIDLYSFDKFLS